MGCSTWAPTPAALRPCGRHTRRFPERSMRTGVPGQGWVPTSCGGVEAGAPHRGPGRQGLAAGGLRPPHSAPVGRLATFPSLLNVQAAQWLRESSGA